MHLSPVTTVRFINIYAIVLLRVLLFSFNKNHEYIVIITICVYKWKQLFSAWNFHLNYKTTRIYCMRKRKWHINYMEVLHFITFKLLLYSTVWTLKRKRLFFSKINKNKYYVNAFWCIHDYFYVGTLVIV